ncbi:MAG: hypothetical protein IJ570_03300 [Prevotella sp.]|nr:hypothetical protein [Prevotella sp.]
MAAKLTICHQTTKYYFFFYVKLTLRPFILCCWRCSCYQGNISGTIEMYQRRDGKVSAAVANSIGGGGEFDGWR